MSFKRKNHYNLYLRNCKNKQKLKIKTKNGMKNTESEEHLPPYHFLYFLFLRLSFLSNQTQLLQKKKSDTIFTNTNKIVVICGLIDLHKYKASV